MALTHHNTVVMFDQTGAGPSNYRLRRRFNGTRCTSCDDLMDSTCYAHSIEFDIGSNKLRLLKLDFDPWCSSGSFLSNGTLVQIGGCGNEAKRIRVFRPCRDHQCDWRQAKKSLSDRRWYASTQILPGHDRVVVVMKAHSLFHSCTKLMTERVIKVFPETVHKTTRAQAQSVMLPFRRQFPESRNNDLWRSSFRSLQSCR